MIPHLLHAAGLAVAGVGLLRRLRPGPAAWAPFPLELPAFLPGLFGLLHLLALGAFLGRRAPRLGAGALFLLLALGSTLVEWQWPPGVGVDNGLSLPALSALAWAIGGREAACGTVAAGYSLAALSKLHGSGLGWATGLNLAQHISTHAWDGAPALLEARLALAASVPLCTALGAATFLIEGSAVLFLLPALRRPWALAAAAMHLGIALVMDLHHYDWMLVTLGLAFGHGSRGGGGTAGGGPKRPGRVVSGG